MASAADLPASWPAASLRLTSSRVRQVEPNVERRAVTGSLFRDREHKLTTNLAVDPIVGVSRVAGALSPVGLLREHTIGERVVEEELRRELVGLRRAIGQRRRGWRANL